MEPRKAKSASNTSTISLEKDIYPKLYNKIVAIYIEALRAAINREIETRAICPQASFPPLDIPFFRPWRKVHQAFAKKAQKKYLVDNLGDGTNFESSSLFLTLKYMSYDEEFFDLIEQSRKFFSALAGSEVPRDMQGLQENIFRFSDAFSEDSFIGQEFRCLEPLIFAKGSEVDDAIRDAQAKIDKNQKHIYSTAVDIGLATPGPLLRGDMAAELGGRKPEFYAKSYSPIVLKQSKKRNEREQENKYQNERESVSLIFKPNVLALYKDPILRLVQSDVFNPELSTGYGSVWYRKFIGYWSSFLEVLGIKSKRSSEDRSSRRVYPESGLDHPRPRQAKKEKNPVSRYFSKVYKKYLKPYQSTANNADRFQLETRLVQQVINNPEGFDISRVIREFRLSWLKKDPTEEQLRKLAELSVYEGLLDNAEIKKDGIDIAEVVGEAIDESKVKQQEFNKISAHLQSVTGTPLLLRKISSVTGVGRRRRGPGEIIPSRKVLDEKSDQEIYSLFYINARCILGSDQEEISYIDGVLSSKNKELNHFLQAIEKESLLSASRKYIFLLIGLAICSVDDRAARNIKELLYLNRTKVDSLYDSILHCPEIPAALKYYFPKWEGRFIPSDNVVNAFNQLKAGRLLEKLEGIQEGKEEKQRDVDISADINSPKTNEQINQLTPEQLHCYAAAVCHEVITVGPVLKKVRKTFVLPKGSSIHEILSGILYEPAFTRKGHQSLKFLLAMLEWYLENKIKAKMFYHPELGIAYAEINKVRQNIRDYLQGTCEAYVGHGISTLGLNTLLNIQYKREPGHSFNKLLKFVALNYTNDQDRSIYDLNFFHDQDERDNQKIRERKQQEREENQWFTLPAFFGAKKIKVEQNVAEHHCTSADPNFVSRRVVGTHEYAEIYEVNGDGHGYYDCDLGSPKSSRNNDANWHFNHAQRGDCGYMGSDGIRTTLFGSPSPQDKKDIIDANRRGNNRYEVRSGNS